METVKTFRPNGNELHFLYYDKKMNLREIAVKFGVNKKTVSNWMRRCNIPTKIGGAGRKGRLYYYSSTPKSSKIPTECDLGWAAGFLEGEGTFTKVIGKGGQHITACQTHTKEPLIKLQQLFGGTVKYRKQVGNSISNNSPWKWSVSGARSNDVARAVYPYLSKRRQKQAKELFNEGPFGIIQLR